MKKLMIVDDNNKIEEFIQVTDFHAVAITGDYNDLKNKPDLTPATPSTPVVSINDNTANYMLTKSLANGILRCTNRKSFKITIPNDSDSRMSGVSTGTMFTFISFAEGVGELVASSGVTIINADNEFKFGGKGSVVTLLKTGSNEYLLAGKTKK